MTDAPLHEPGGDADDAPDLAYELRKLDRELATPATALIAVEVASTALAEKWITRWQGAHPHRQFTKMDFDAMSISPSELLQDTKNMEFSTPSEALVRCLVDKTPVWQKGDDTYVKARDFWRGMNLLREGWGALEGHTLFILNPQAYERLLRDADHLNAWVPLRIHLFEPTAAGLESHAQAAQSSSGNPFIPGILVAKDRMATLEAQLLQAKQRGEPDDVLTRRSYLPLLGAAIAAGAHKRIISLLETIEDANVRIADYTDWLGLQAQAHLDLAHYDMAQQMASRYLESAAADGDPIKRGEALNVLGEVFWRIGNHAEALRLSEQRLDLAKATLDPQHRTVATAHNNLALQLKNAGRLREAEGHYREALAIDEANFGKEHPDVASSCSNLGALLYQMGRLDEAAELMQRAVDIFETTLGADHTHVAIGKSGLGIIYEAMGKLTEAEGLYREAIRIDQAALPSDHPSLATRYHNLGDLLMETERAEEALPLLQDALRIFEAKLPPTHPDIEDSRQALASCKAMLGQA